MPHFSKRITISSIIIGVFILIMASLQAFSTYTLTKAIYDAQQISKENQSKIDRIIQLLELEQDRGGASKP